MKKLAQTLAFAIALTGVFTSCEEDKKDNNGGNNPTTFKQELVYDGTTYTLKEAFIIDYGVTDNAANFDINLVSDGITVQFDNDGAPIGATGDGFAVYIEAWSADTVKFADGTYTIDTVDLGKAGTISYASIDRIQSGQFMDESEWAEGSSCTIEVNDKEHTITGSGTTRNGKSFSFSFRKEFDYIDDDVFKKKFRL